MNKPEADQEDSKLFSVTICGCGSLMVIRVRSVAPCSSKTIMQWLSDSCRGGFNFTSNRRPLKSTSRLQRTQRAQTDRSHSQTSAAVTRFWHLADLNRALM